MRISPIRNCQSIVQMSNPLLSLNDKLQIFSKRKLVKHPNRIAINAYRAKLDSELIFGLYPVESALFNRQREQFYQLFVKLNHYNEYKANPAASNPVFQSIMRMARDLHIKKNPVNVALLDALSNQRPHQGVVLETSNLPFPFATDLVLDNLFANFKAASPPTLLFLDEVKDVMNLGAMLRTALFFSVRCVFLPAHQCCPLLPIVSKLSSGAMEALRFFRVDDKPHFLRRLQQRFDAQIVGTCGLDDEVQSRQPALAVVSPNDLSEPHLLTAGDEEDNIDRSDNTISALSRVQKRDILRGIKSRPTLLALGREDKGLTREVREHCDFFMQIPGSHHSTVPALNVSVSFGIMMNALHSIKTGMF